MRERKRNVITVSGSIAEEVICEGIVRGQRKPPVACSTTSGSDTVFPNSLRVFYSKQTNNDIFLKTLSCPELQNSGQQHFLLLKTKDSKGNQNKCSGGGFIPCRRM
jgi:hypothetical protein